MFYILTRRGVSRLYLFDLVAFVDLSGSFFGRLANFVNGELVGRPAGPEVTWAVKFPQDIFQWSGDTKIGFINNGRRKSWYH